MLTGDEPSIAQAWTAKSAFSLKKLSDPREFLARK
jgi:hypothetical protein